MGGGLMQLVAYGAQDIYLTGNPQITFFKVVYRRHTNFSMESIQQTMSGTGSASDGQSGTVTISRNGDLVCNVYLTTDTINITNGSKIIKDVQLDIGGQRIDKHTSEWMDLWNELSTPESKAVGLKSMQGNVGTSGSAAAGVSLVQVPLQFWFCKNPGLALPLIALQYHEVKLIFNWDDKGNYASAGATVDASCKVWVDYIYLDTDERRRFAQVSHEYLIEQVQENSLSPTENQNRLTFNHPVKELLWTSPVFNEYKTGQLKLNGHDRFAQQQAEYFQLRQPYQHHSAVPRQNLPSAAQISLLDRQSTMSAVGTVVLSAGKATKVVTTDTDQLHYADNVLSYNGTADIDPAEELEVGTLLSLTVTNVAGVTGTNTPAVGETYFATVTANAKPGGAGVVTLTTLTHVKADGTTKTITEILAAGAFILSQISNGSSSEARTSKMVKKINVYSFGLKPEEHQPSGTCNFSRIDTAELVFEKTVGAGHHIYAVNYNVLRIMSGMGGLAYSN